MPILTYQSGIVGGTGGAGPIVSQIPADAVITGFTIWADGQVEQMLFTYQSGSQGSGSVTLKCSTGGQQQPTVTLQPGEVITSIQGTISNEVQTVEILTNMNQYGYGTSYGSRPFRLDIPGNCRFTGVYGYTGDHIDSFGIYFVGPSAG